MAKEISVDLENVKQLIFGTTIKPTASEGSLFKVIFWPDAFLLASFLFSAFLVIALFLFSRKITLIKINSNIASASAIFFCRFACFFGLVGSASATLRVFIFVFGESTESYGNQAAVTIFSIIFLIPAFACAGLVAIFCMAMYFLLGLRLQK